MKNYIIKNQRQLRYGSTTGSCAAAAATAAAQLLLTGIAPATIHLQTPKGTVLDLEIESARQLDQKAICAVRKDSGDDPDATNGILISATVCYTERGICLEGGKGVGRVTRPGLACAVGQPAINPEPRKQIIRSVEQIAQKHAYKGGFHIVIAAKDGEEVAKHTFNARMGILGGISILGTSGIVEPMSEQALIETIQIEMDSRWAAGERDLCICPGNYGLDFIKSDLAIDPDKAITVSNFIGEALDYATFKGFESLLLVGHAGKLIKLAAGVMQTHSAVADGRQEIFAAHAALYGANRDDIQQLMECVSVDACMDLLIKMGIVSPVMKSIGQKIEEHLWKRTREVVRTEFIIFTNTYGEIIRSHKAAELLKRFEENHI